MKVLSISPFLEGATINPYFGGKCVVSLQIINGLVENGHEVFVLPWEDEKIWNETKFRISNDASYALVLPTLYYPRLTNLTKDIFLSFFNKQALKHPQKHIWRRVRNSLYNKNVFLKEAMDAVRPDIVHVHYTYSNVPDIYRKHKFKAPLLLTHHSKGLNEKVSLYDYTVFVSESQYQEACTLMPKLAEKSTYVHNCVDDQYLRPAQPGKSNNIVFLGRLKDQKGVNILLDSFQIDRELSQYNLFIIGERDKENEYKQFVKTHSLHNVRFLGRLSPRKNTDVMEKASLFVAPSKAEGFALMYIEALCMGLPIIGFPPNLKEHRNILGMEVGYEFDANNETPEHLANLIKKAMSSELTSPEYRKELMRRARNAYSYKTFKKKYLDIYSMLVHNQ